ncbi:MAG TPA: hypothetical protein VF759_02765 [Allosphingosinicella sp.]|jgi:hypothetical protein
MKIIIFAAALTLGGAALAQTGNTVSDPSQSSGPRGVTQQGTDPEGQACTPPGYNAGTTGYPTCEAGSGTPASTATPPRCSKTVTDHCVQAYERGVRR